MTIRKSVSSKLKVSDICNPKKELLKRIDNERPTPYREYDQIYMKIDDMFKQYDLLKEYVVDTDLVFLGDGDSMSILFSTKGKYSPKSITVLDFDERILNNIKQITQDEGNQNINTELYNVINTIPLSHRKKYNFFYINPPYGSKNNGLSCKIWLYRCFELCCDKCFGCIIIPYDEEQVWTKINMNEIQLFLANNGFVIRDMISLMHSYYLEDNPKLLSAALIVEKVKNIDNEFDKKEFPDVFMKNIYGNPRKIPKYIFDDNTVMGKLDMNWKYGKEFWS